MKKREAAFSSLSGRKPLSRHYRIFMVQWIKNPLNVFQKNIGNLNEWIRNRIEYYVKLEKLK
jgi:hypothetical protein